MKTKAFLVGLVAFACAFVMSSCGDPLGPKEWNMEIEDEFRITVASGIMYAMYDEEDLGDFAELVDDNATDQIIKHLFDKHIARYKLALEELQENAACAECLVLYNELDVKFPEWKKEEDRDGHSVWTCEEESTGLTVTFMNNDDLDWSVEVDDDQLEEFCVAVVEALMD